MKPPYEITPEILKYVASISEKIGEINAKYLIKSNPTLRKQKSNWAEKRYYRSTECFGSL